MWSTIVNTVVIYLFIVVGMRLLGKKEIGQLSIGDLVFIMLVSEAMGDVMRASNDTLTGAVIAGGMLMVLSKALDLSTYKFKGFKRLAEGAPAVLVRHGKINHKEMRRNRITLSELEQAAREHGKGDVATVELAILETDGKVSIIESGEVKTSVPFSE